VALSSDVSGSGVEFRAPKRIGEALDKAKLCAGEKREKMVD
jgi:hypothetical protein